MDNRQLHKQIDKLVTEERELEECHLGKRATPEQEQRLHELQVALDQCWDLLRQRRARREFNQGMSNTNTRAADVVEGYKQ
jgi:hypothetical protein